MSRRRLCVSRESFTDKGKRKLFYSYILVESKERRGIPVSVLGRGRGGEVEVSVGSGQRGEGMSGVGLFGGPVSGVLRPGPRGH